MRTLVLGRPPQKANEISLSIDVFPGVQRLEDLTEPWPLKDNYFDEVTSDSILEPADLELFLSECYRVLVKGGELNLHIKMSMSSIGFVMQRFKKPNWDDKEQLLTAIK